MWASAVLLSLQSYSADHITEAKKYHVNFKSVCLRAVKMKTEKYLSRPELSSVLSKPEKDSIQESRFASSIWAGDTCDSFLFEFKGKLKNWLHCRWNNFNFSTQVLYCTSTQWRPDRSDMEACEGQKRP